MKNINYALFVDANLLHLCTMIKKINKFWIEPGAATRDSLIINLWAVSDGSLGSGEWRENDISAVES